MLLFLAVGDECILVVDAFSVSEGQLVVRKVHFVVVGM